MPRVCFIYNPASGRNRSAALFRQLKTSTGSWNGVKYVTSREAGDMADLARRAAERYDIVVACGGDGTVSEISGGLVGGAAALGIVPMGNGNDCAKAMGIPADPGEALRLIRQGDAVRVDTGLCNGRHFINTLGFGYDGLTNRYARSLRRVPGSLKYLLSALRAAGTHRRYVTAIGGEGIPEREVSSRIMVTLANGRVEGGSFQVAPRALIDDGRLQMLEVAPVPRLLLPFLLPLFLVGCQDRLPWVRYRSVRSCSIRFDRAVPVHADGEIWPEEQKSFEVSVRPGALRCVCGPGAFLAGARGADDP